MASSNLSMIGERDVVQSPSMKQAKVLKQDVVEPAFKYENVSETTRIANNIKARLKLKLINVNLAGLNTGDLRN